MPGAVNPVLVEVTRGDLVESVHRGAFAVVDAAGRVQAASGDIERPVYARSAIKPLQAVPLVETGALDAFELSEAELALACASHGGEPMHVERVQDWLARLGLGEADLECGPQAPTHGPSRRSMLRADQPPTRLHNNCSGKHAGFLTAARHLGEPTKGYLRPDHPSQQRWRRVLAELSDTSLDDAASGVDGCGIPVIALGLHATALAMARLADPRDLAPERAAAARRIAEAMATYPELVAGSGRFCTDVMAVTGRRALVKTGAEGVFTAMLPERGLGVVLKIDDGAVRAAEVAIGAVLEQLNVFRPVERDELVDYLNPPVLNRAGREVGRIRAVLAQ